MRITFVCPPDGLSGGLRVIALYAGRLAGRGHRVAVVMPQPRGPSLSRRLRTLARRGQWLSAPHFEGPSFFDQSGLDHRTVAHAGPITDRDVPDADLVVATWWETAEWVWGLSRAKGIKAHFMQDYETWGVEDGNTARVDATCALPMPKIVIARWVADLLERRWQQTPIALVPNSVETDKFFAPPRGKQPVPTVGLTYTTMPAKGTDLSLAAYRQARETIPELRLVAFGGSQPGAGPLALPAEAEFHHRAPDDQLRTIYARCDAWLFGTRREGFGLPILEAMACRTPVIGTPAGAAPELLSKGGGILVPMEDAASMAEAIVRVCRMPEAQWRTLSDAAYQTATAWTWDDATNRFEAALQRIAAGKTAEPGVATPGLRPHQP